MMKGKGEVPCGILMCKECEKEIERCQCVIRMPECKKVNTTICPTCAEQAMAQNIHQGGKDYVNDDVSIEKMAPVKVKPVDIQPMVVATNKGNMICMQLTFAQPTCPHCKMGFIFDKMEILLPFAQVQSFLKDLKTFNKKPQG